MAATGLIPIECVLPDGWRSVPPAETDAGDVAFVALHPASSNGFTANITIGGEVGGAEVPLALIADETLARLRTSVHDLRIGERVVFGSAHNPGLTQAVRLSVELHGRMRDIVQLQVHVGFRDTRDRRGQVVLHIVLSATPEQFEHVIGDFQQFVSTIRPDRETP